MDGSEITRFLQAGATSPVLQSQDDVALHVKGYKRMRADLVSREAAMMACPVELDDGTFGIFCAPDQHGQDTHQAVEDMLHALSRPAEAARQIIPSWRIRPQLLLTLVRERLDGNAIRQRRAIGRESSAVRKIFHDIVAWAARHHASDIHLNLRENERDSEVRMSIDGRYVAPASLQMSTDRLLEMLKVAWLEGSGGKQAFFDTRIEQQCRLWDVVDGQQYLLRWGSFVTDQGPAITLRLHRSSATQRPQSFQTLGYLPSQIDAIETAIHTEGGAILLAGVVGSGKTTTIGSVLSMLPDWRKVMGIEDPVELMIRNALQASIVRNMGDDAQDNFGPKLMMLKRSAPTDVLLGEIRDRQTGRAFQDIVESGTNLYSTVHVGSATGTPSRLASAQIGVALDVLAAPGILKLLIFQALLPLLCDCALPLDTLDDGCLDAMGRARDARHWHGYRAMLKDLYGPHADRIRVRNQQGCAHCRKAALPALNGYRGRTVVAEHFAPGENDDALHAIARRDWIALRGIHRAASDRDPASANMCGKHAMDCAIYKMLHSQLDPRDIEPRFRPFTALSREMP